METKQSKTAAKAEKFAIYLDGTWEQTEDDGGVLVAITCKTTGKIYTRNFAYTKDQAIAYFGSMAEVYRRKHPVKE